MNKRLPIDVETIDYELEGWKRDVLVGAGLTPFVRQANFAVWTKGDLRVVLDLRGHSARSHSKHSPVRYVQSRPFTAWLNDKHGELRTAHGRIRTFSTLRSAAEAALNAAGLA